MSQTDTNLPDYERSIEELEHIIRQIETSQVGLEAGLKQYERGMQLIGHCQKILDRAETKIEQLNLQAKTPTDAQSFTDAGTTAEPTPTSEPDPQSAGEGEESLPF